MFEELSLRVKGKKKKEVSRVEAPVVVNYMLYKYA